jgi:subtilisin family serine protease
MFQNADSVDLDDFLYARKLDGALQYQFNVIQVDSGVNQIITKDDNYFSLLELENNEAYYDKEYRIKVRAIFEEDTADWGGETVLKTIDEQMYKFGKVRLHFKQEHFEEYSSFKIRNNVLANNYIPNFNELSSISNIFEYGFPIKNILQKLHKDPYSCIDLQFDKKFSVDSIVNYFNSTQLCEFVVPIYNVTLSVDPVDYSTVDENCWHLTDVSAPDAWDITTGSSTTLIAVLDNTFNIDHEDIRDNIFINIEEIPLGVIILDYNGNGFIDADDLLTYSGYGTLRELFDAQPSNIFNLSDDSGNLIADDIIGWDCGDGDNNILPEHSNGDYYNHGTSVCHVAGGVTNNNNSGIASLSHNTRIIPIKLASDESDYTMNSSYDPLVALNYLISLNEKPDVISMSFTTGTDIPLFEATLNLFYSEFNTISIAAVGNDGAVINESNPMYPACYNNVVAVGATNSDNEIADFSNHGSIQNTYVLAPGQDIYTARAGIPFGINDSYDYVDGTSFSAPLVSALASLIYSYNPNVTAETVREAIECGCQNNTIQMNDYSPDDHGYGKVNAYQSLLCIQNMAPVANIEEEFDFY